MTAKDWSWLDPALRRQAPVNVEAASEVKTTSSYPDPASISQTVVDMEPANEVKTAFSYPDPALMPQASVDMKSVSEVNEGKVPAPDYSQVLDPVKLSEMWAVSQTLSMSASESQTNVPPGLAEPRLEPSWRHERLPSQV
jgi:hypothetical protein